MSRVLLTGASGLLGAHALKYLIDNTNYEIVCPVSYKHHGVPPRIDAILSEQKQDQCKRVHVVYCDLKNPVLPSAKMFGDITHIFNFASETDILTSFDDPVSHIQNNVNITLYLLDYARSLKDLQAFVQISTNEVYAPNKFSDVYEWDPIKPTSPYSAAKAAQECIALGYAQSYNVPVMIINTMNIFGEMQDAHKFIPQLINRIYLDKTVKIFTNQHMKPMEQLYLHASDVISAIMFLLESEKSIISRRWNVCGNLQIDGVSLARKVAHTLHKNLKISLHDIPQRGEVFLSNHDLKQKGWAPEFSFSTQLRHMIDWSLAHPQWVGLEKEL